MADISSVKQNFGGSIAKQKFQDLEIKQRFRNNDKNIVITVYGLPRYIKYVEVSGTIDAINELVGYLSQILNLQGEINNVNTIIFDIGSIQSLISISGDIDNQNEIIAFLSSLVNVNGVIENTNTIENVLSLTQSIEVVVENENNMTASMTLTSPYKLVNLDDTFLENMDGLTLDELSYVDF